jgi:hypothetical protein
VDLPSRPEILRLGAQAGQTISHLCGRSGRVLLQFCVQAATFPFTSSSSRNCELGLWRLTAHKIAEVFGTRLQRYHRGMLSTSWQDIEVAINTLDGKQRGVVSIGGEGKAHMSVGGGEAGQYAVYATFDNANFFTLLPLELTEGNVLLFVAGQQGNYDKRLWSTFKAP